MTLRNVLVANATTALAGIGLDAVWIGPCALEIVQTFRVAAIVRQ